MNKADLKEAQSEILDALDAGEISEEQADQILAGLDKKWADMNPTVVEEMHPDISGVTRAVYKNLGTDPETSFNYLQKQHPNLQWKKQGDRVLAKRPEETEWRVLDPDTGFFSKDFLNDVTDLGSEAVSIPVETAATVTAGLAGGAASGGLGAIPAAMAAGGASSAGMETLRQYLGQKAGINDGFDGGQIAFSGGVGTVAPLVGGTGATAKQVAKYAARKGIAPELVEEYTKNLMKSQSGVVSRGAGAATLKAGEMLSGIPSPILDWARQNLDKIKNASQSSGVASNVREAHDKLWSKYRDVRAKSSRMYGEALDASEVVVNPKEHLQPVYDLLTEYKQRADEETLAAVTKFGKEEGEKIASQMGAVKDYNWLKKQVQEYSTNKDVLVGKEAKGFLDKLNDLTKVRKTGGDISTKDTLEKQLEVAAKESAVSLGAKLTEGLEGAGLRTANEDWQKVASQGELLKEYFKSPKKTESTLRNLGSEAQTIRAEDVVNLGDDLGVDLADTYLEQRGIGLFSRPSEKVASFASSSTGRELAGAGVGGLTGYMVGRTAGEEGGLPGNPFMYGMLGAYLGRGMGSPANMRRMMTVGDWARTGKNAINQTQIPMLPANIPMTGTNIYKQLLMNEEQQ